MGWLDERTEFEEEPHMSQKWEDGIRDPKDRKVFEALSDPGWDFRTVAGISKAVDLSESEVLAILERYPELVRRSAIPDSKGRDLYTLRSRPMTGQEFAAEVRLFVTKTLP